MAFFTMLEFRNQPFRVALGASLAEQPGAERRDDTDETMHQALFGVLCQMDDFNPAVLELQQLLDVIETKAS